MQRGRRQKRRWNLLPALCKFTCVCLLGGLVDLIAFPLRKRRLC